MCDIKREMRERASLARGLANALASDVDYIWSDVRAFDVICLGESIREAKDTLKRIGDNISELEQLLEIVKS